MLGQSVNPVCSPARSTWFTGRMPVETGVYTNDRPILAGMPTMGHWFRERGYETVYCGKWHLPEGWYVDEAKGFRALPAGCGQGSLADAMIANTLGAWIRNRRRDSPFLAVAGFMNPHDICYWCIDPNALVPARLPFEVPPEALPDLPPNWNRIPEEPAKLAATRYRQFDEQRWRYYRYIYFRNVEMVDTQVGRLLDALEASGEAANTLVLFTSDHGEGGGRHSRVQKWHPYEESLRVPLVLSSPGRIPANRRDEDRLVSHLDILPTLCDYAEFDAPPGVHGASLRSPAEGRETAWRSYTVSEMQVVGRTVRTRDYKYVRFLDDPVEQFFDLRNDPWETRNLYRDPACAGRVADHRRMLEEWDRRMTYAPGAREAAQGIA